MSDPVSATLDAAPPARPFRLTRRPEERVRVLGAAMDLMRPEEVLHFTRGRIERGEKGLVANHNVHSLHLIQRNAELRAFFAAADVIEVDSVPVIAWARLVGRSSRRFHRCTYLDWRDRFWRMTAEHGWRVFHLGGAPGVASVAAARLRAEWPGAEIGIRHGFFDMAVGSAANEAVMAEIAAFRPDVLLVGMGMPRQEAWVVRNYAALPPCVVFTVGAAFDYEGGEQTAAPRWMGRMGVEWLFRLFSDPKRLAYRYCVEPWSLVGPALADLKAALAR